MAVKVKDQKSKLDRTQVLSAAFDVVDRDGLDALTIRHLAAQLGVTPMALYWHFADKQALLDALVDSMWADAKDHLATSPASSDPMDEFQRLIQALVSAFRKHPTLAVLAPFRAIECEAGLDITEGALQMLSQLGFTPRQSAFAARMALTSAIMLVSTQPGIESPDNDDRDELMRAKRAAIATLAPQRYPFLIAAGPDLIDCDDPENYYAAGIEMILAGVVAASAAVG
ncbi:MAG TPA: TetR family transcriptional regulator [Acidimicrobiales bacterium]